MGSHLPVSPWAGFIGWCRCILLWPDTNLNDFGGKIPSMNLVRGMSECFVKQSSFKTLSLTPSLGPSTGVGVQGKDWCCSSCWWGLILSNLHNVECFFQMLVWRESDRTWHSWETCFWAAVTPVGIWSLAVSCGFCVLCTCPFFFSPYFLNVITRNMGTNIFNTLYSGCLCSLQAPEYYFPSLQILRGTQVLSYSAHKVQKFALPLSCLRKGGVLLLWLCF